MTRTSAHRFVCRHACLLAVILAALSCSLPAPAENGGALCGLPPRVPAGLEGILFKDAFVRLLPDNWWTTRGSWKDKFGEGKPADSSAVVVRDGKLKLTADKTDHVGVVYSRPIAIPKGAKIKFSRRMFVHAASRKFGGVIEFFGVPQGKPSAEKPPIQEHLFGVTYNNFDYEADWNCFALITGANFPKGPGKHQGGQAPFTAPLWDNWFTEEIVYDGSTGETVYSMNGQEKMRVTGSRLEQPCIKLMMHPYGWGTGHFMEISDLSITLVSGGDSGKATQNDGHEVTDTNKPQTGGKPANEPSTDRPKLLEPPSTPMIQEERSGIESLIREAVAAMSEKNAQRAAACFREFEQEEVRKGFGVSPGLMAKNAEILRGAQIDYVSSPFTEFHGATQNAELVAISEGHEIRIGLEKFGSKWSFCLNGGRQ
ncbi:MAG: hypothetical protein HQM08_25100 [Candidatus Riflebacteria bacterium]|nr:hypothetical protein [Candidatus Riflebacteria bacterium]